MIGPISKTVFLASAVCLAGPLNAGAGNVPGPVELVNFVCDGNYFSVKLPKAWPKTEMITAGRQAREYGVDLKGPKNSEGAYARISIIYYGANHRLVKTMDKYIRLNSGPDTSLPLAGEEYGPVRDISVAGRKGKTFEVKTFVFIPPYGVKPKKVPVLEKKVILPGEKGGLYVLIYHVPSDIAQANSQIFEKTLNTFKPGP
jgi:hypothetical protein